jgi:hypothetical protein
MTKTSARPDQYAEAREACQSKIPQASTTEVCGVRKSTAVQELLGRVNRVGPRSCYFEG